MLSVLERFSEVNQIRSRREEIRDLLGVPAPPHKIRLLCTRFMGLLCVDNQEEKDRPATI